MQSTSDSSLGQR